MFVQQPIDPVYPEIESVESVESVEIATEEPQFLAIDTAARKQGLLFSDDEIEAVLTGGASSGPSITVNRPIPTIEFV